jgi:hypothetical protein
MSPFSLDRRSFLAAGLGNLAAPPAPKLLDIHVHLFGVGEGRTGCRMAKSVTNSWTFRLLVSTLGLRKRNKPLDVEYERVLVEHLEGSGMTRSARTRPTAAASPTGTGRRSTPRTTTSSR